MGKADRSSVAPDAPAAPGRAQVRTSTRTDARAYPRLSTIHRWLGVALGAWFALVGLTGALLVWRDEVDAALNPTLFASAATASANAAVAASPPALLDAEQIAEFARGTHQLGRIERIRLPATAGAPYRLQLRASASRVESGRIEAFIDARSGTLLGVRSLEGLSLAPPHLMRTLYDSHRNILLGEPGSNFVGIAGFLLMASALTGAVVAWPRTRERWKKLLAINWRGNATRVVFDLHRASGSMMALLLLLTTCTGATLVYLNYVRELVSVVSRVEPIPVLPFRTGAADEVPLTLSQLGERVNQAFPAHRVSEIRFSERGLTGVLFQLHARGDVHRMGDTIVWLHPVSGELLAERSGRTRSAGEGFMHWLLPLHVGSAFGTPGLVAMCAAGIAPLLLVGTGLWVWWRKRPSERLARQRARERAGRAGHAAGGGDAAGKGETAG